MKLVHDADLTDCNTLRLPARARALAEIEHWYELEKVLDDQSLANLPCLVLGDGSNILFRDDYPGLVLRIANRGIHELDQAGNDVFLRIAAGENWHHVVEWACRRGYWGIENLALIPGTAGAAPVQNIGAYGVELEERVVSVRAYDRLDARWCDFKCEQCEFSYRDSLFKRDAEDRYCITELVLRLSLRGEPRLEYPGLREAVDALELESVGPAEVGAAVTAIRRSKLPDPAAIPNVGSFFKNPILAKSHAAEVLAAATQAPHWPLGDRVKLSAAWLIDQCGYKGHRSGDAGVYEGHALVLVNHGAARGRDLWELALEIQDSVFERFGVRLEPEPLIV